MHFLARIFAVLLFVLSVQATFDTVLSDLKAVNTSCKSLNDTINAYNGSGVSYLAMRQSYKGLVSSVMKTTSDVDASNNPSQTQAQSLLDYSNKNIVPYLRTIVAGFKRNRSTFKTVGIISDMVYWLKDLKAYFDSLCDKLIAKAPSTTLKAGFQTLNNTIDAIFNDGIAYLST